MIIDFRLWKVLNQVKVLLRPYKGLILISQKSVGTLNHNVSSGAHVAHPTHVTSLGLLPLSTDVTRGDLRARRRCRQVPRRATMLIVGPIIL